MSIKIHHGPDGTFKTSGAIKDDILKIVKTGRLLVTNVRGFSRDKCVAVLGHDKVHSDFDVLHVDTDIQAGRDKLQTFFHWAPKGAFFVIDEVQRIFPSKMTEKELRTLDYPEPQEHLPEDQRRPETIHVAWDMQRHHNWDFVFTTTNIKKVHDMARVMAKVAVRHVNIGIWRFYKTVEHDAESNGKTQASITTSKTFNYVPSKIFELYASTTTGLHNNTEPRTPFYKDFKIMSLLLFLVCLIVYMASKPLPKAISGEQSQDNQEQANVPVTQTSKMDSQKNSDKTAGVAGSVSDNKFLFGADSLEQLPMVYLSQFQQLYLTGYVKEPNSFTASFKGLSMGREYIVRHDMLKQLGINITLFSECIAHLKAKNFSKYVFCEPTQPKEPIPQPSFTPPNEEDFSVGV
jgi:zona occludens toxin